MRHLLTLAALGLFASLAIAASHAEYSPPDRIAIDVPGADHQATSLNR
jgi:hypothetical protein